MKNQIQSKQRNKLGKSLEIKREDSLEKVKEEFIEPIIG